MTLRDQCVEPTQLQATTTFAGDLIIWGASLWGESDPAVIVAEYGDHYWSGGSLWDVKGHSQWQQWQEETSSYEPVPLSWSLPWVTEQRRRLEMAK